MLTGVLLLVKFAIGKHVVAPSIAYPANLFWFNVLANSLKATLSPANARVFFYNKLIYKHFIY